MNKNNSISMPEDHMDGLYNSQNFLVKFVFRNKIDLIIRSMPKKKGLKILDAGCGEGHIIEAMYNKENENEYYGIDADNIALENARSRCPYAKLTKMNLSNITFKNEFFDVIICTDVIEHIHDYKIVLDRFQRILKKGGYLIITFPNETLWTISRFILRRRPIKVPEHVNSFTPTKFMEIVKIRAVSKINYPFRLPFFLSLGCLIKFKKQ